MKKIILASVNEFKRFTVFYTLLFWFCIWLIYVIYDRFKSFENLEDNTQTNLFTNLSDKILKNASSLINNRNQMELLEFKMNSLEPTPKFLYLDSGVINLLYSIKEFEESSSVIFKQLIKLLDDFFEIIYNLQSQNLVSKQLNPYILFDNLKEIKSKILNTMEEFIFNIPSQQNFENKLWQAVQSMHYILNLHIENIRNIYNKQLEKTDYNIYNKYLEKSKIKGATNLVSKNFNIENYLLH